MKSLFGSTGKEIITRPKRVEEATKPYVFTLKKAWIPPADHPWRSA